MTKKKASEDMFNELHNIVTQELLNRIKSGEASTQDLKAACDWLSKNDVNTTGAVVDQTANNTYINSNLFNEEAGWSVGLGVHIPFGGPPTGNCKRLFAVAKAESYILVLDKLLDKKAITLAEYTQLVKDLMEDLNDKKESK